MLTRTPSQRKISSEQKFVLIEQKRVHLERKKYSSTCWHDCWAAPMFKQQQELQTKVSQLYLSPERERNVCTVSFHVRQHERRSVLAMQAMCPEREFVLFWEVRKKGLWRGLIWTETLPIDSSCVQVMTWKSTKLNTLSFPVNWNIYMYMYICVYMCACVYIYTNTE